LTLEGMTLGGGLVFFSQSPPSVFLGKPVFHGIGRIFYHQGGKQCHERRARLLFWLVSWGS
jgi:hypothetical protein